MIYVFICFYIIYLAINIYYTKKFVATSNKYKTSILMDKTYALLLVLNFFIYYGLIFEGAFLSILNHDYYSEIPVIFLFTPVIINGCNIFIREGLISYNENYLIGYNCIYDMNNIKVRKVKFSKFGRVKIVLSVEIIKNKNKTKKNLTIRTSNEKYKLLEKTFKLKMCY